jgi:hypothetical protein
MDDLFKRTLTDVDYYSKVLKSIAERSVELGLARTDVTVQRAHAKVDAALREYMDATEKAKELGYSSLKIALKALQQIKQQPAYDFTKLPLLFHKIPAIWLSGKPDNKIAKGFAPMRVRDAERAHRVIIPLLIEAWKLINGDEEVQEQVEKDYRNMSAKQFETELYVYINELEEPTLEEQLAERQQLSQVEFEDWQEQNAKARALQQKRRIARERK